MSKEINATNSSPAWQATPRNAHQTEWARVRVSTNATGRTITNRTSYTEVSNFLNVQNPETGVWIKSRPEFIATASGFESRGSGCKVVLMSDIAQPGAINVTSSDGVALHTTPLGLSLTDGQNAVVFAEIKSSTAKGVTPLTDY